MKMRVMLAGALALAATTSWAQSSNAKVDPALQAKVTKFAQAFDAADPKAFASFFASDATIINPLGEVAHGTADIEKVFARSGAPTFKGSKSTMTITGSRQLGPDFVWLDVDHVAQHAHTPDGKTGELKPHMVILAQKQGDDWKWSEVRAAFFVPRDHAHSGPAQIRPK